MHVPYMGSNWKPPSYYTGAATLAAYDSTVTLPKIRITTFRLEADGLEYWQGTARLPGLVQGLYDILGDVCTITLTDGPMAGTTAEAYATGHTDGSAWIIELQGTGSPPGKDTE